VATTISGGRQFGRRWRNMMRASARPRQMRRLDIFAPALDQGGAAHGAGVVGPLHDDQRDDDLVDALAEERREDQRDEDGREGELQVDDAHDQRVGPPAA
jgi:hypothetical protein